MKTHFRRSILALLILAIATVVVAYAQQPKKGSNNNTDTADEQMDKRGDHIMGFDHTKTTHHFLLQESGGSIEVTANSSKDVASSEQIKMHLKHIARMFRRREFQCSNAYPRSNASWSTSDARIKGRDQIHL